MFTGLLGAFVNMILVQRFIGVTVLKQLAANGRALASIAVMAAGVSFASGYLPDTTDKVELALQLAILVALGGVLYCGSTLLLWILMKRPAGPRPRSRRSSAKSCRGFALLLAPLEDRATASCRTPACRPMENENAVAIKSGPDRQTAGHDP